MKLYQEIQVKPGEGRIATAHPERLLLKFYYQQQLPKRDGKIYKLIAFQNVMKHSMKRNQGMAEIVKRMTHEIMNSVAPISSLPNNIKNTVTAVR